MPTINHWLWPPNEVIYSTEGLFFFIETRAARELRERREEKQKARRIQNTIGYASAPFRSVTSTCLITLYHLDYLFCS